MEDQLKLFCRYCGLYKNPAKRISKEIISRTWKKAYSDYKNKPPILSKY